MPALNDLTKFIFTPKQWVTFYRNVWARNLINKTVDIECDKILKTQDPEMVVEHKSKMVTIGERLEFRKEALKEMIVIIKGIDVLLETVLDNNADFEKKYWSEEALAVAEDMLPKKEEETPATPEDATPSKPEETPLPEAVTPTPEPETPKAE